MVEVEGFPDFLHVDAFCYSAIFQFAHIDNRKVEQQRLPRTRGQESQSFVPILVKMADYEEQGLKTEWGGERQDSRFQALQVVNSSFSASMVDPCSEHISSSDSSSARSSPMLAAQTFLT